MCHARRNAKLVPAITRLLRAQENAQDACKEPWEFAVEIEELRQLGLDRIDLRWLVAKGLVQQGPELTMPNDTKRSFRSGGQAMFLKHSCFILTKAGVEFALNPGTASQGGEPQRFGCRPEACRMDSVTISNRLRWI